VLMRSQSSFLLFVALIVPPACPRAMHPVAVCCGPGEGRHLTASSKGVERRAVCVCVCVCVCVSHAVG
jgi:hypothetical protein